MNQLNIDINADSRNARREFDALDRSIRSIGRSLVESSSFLTVMQGLYRDLNDTVARGETAVDLEERRRDALAGSAEAIRQSGNALREPITGAEGATTGDSPARALLAGVFDRINGALDDLLDREWTAMVRETAPKTGNKSHSNTPDIDPPTDLTIPVQPHTRGRMPRVEITEYPPEPGEFSEEFAQRRLDARYQQLVLMEQLRVRELELDGKYDEIALGQLEQRYEDEMAILSGEEEAQLLLTGQYQREKERIQKEASQRETQRQMQIVAGTARMFGGMAQIANAFGKSGFKAWKRLSQAQAVLDGVQAVQSAYAWGMKYGGPLLATVNATIAAGVTAANVASIQSQSYARGGLVQARVSNGEYFVDPDTARRHRSTLELVRSGVIRGPGSGTSDSIPALIPEGGYIVPAAATRAWEPLLHHMADGGWTGYELQGSATPTLPATMGLQRSREAGSRESGTSADRLGGLLEGIRNQLRAVNANLASNRPVIRIENRSRDIETVIRTQDFARNRMYERGYDGKGQSLAL